MPSINMIAPRRAEKRRLESNVRKLLTVILAEVIIVGLVAGLMFTRLISTQSKISALQVEITKLQPTVNKIEYYDKATSALAPKLETLNAAKTETKRWSRILDDLSASMPEKMWLTRLSAQMPNQPTATEMKISMNGVAANQETVGDTMLRIQGGVPDFSRVDLHYTQKSSLGSLTAVEFEIAAGVKLDRNNDKEVEKS